MAKKTLGEKQFETYKDSADAVLMKAKRLNKSYKGSSPVNKAKMEKKHDLKKMFKESRKASNCSNMSRKSGSRSKSRRTQ